METNLWWSGGSTDFWMALKFFNKNKTLGEVKIKEPAFEKKENPIGALIVGNKEYTSKLTKYADYATYGYYAVPTVGRCVNMLSDAAANIKIVLKKRKKGGESEDVKEHAILDLIKRPNPKMGSGQFFASLFKDHYVFGNSFCLADKGVTSKVPTELWRANPVHVGIDKGSKGLPNAYEYKVATGKKTFPVDQATGKSQIFHFYLNSLDDDWYGDSPMRPCRTWIDVSAAGSEWNAALLENSGRPSAAVMSKAGLTEEQKAALREMLDTKYAGARNAGRIALLTGDIEWKELSLSPKDMDFLASLNYADRKISDTYGIPFPLLSPEAATFSNMDTARESLYEDTIVPFVESYLDSFSNWLIPQFPGAEGMYLCIDYNSIAAYEGKNQRKADKLKTLADSSLIKIDEAREELGYEAYKDGSGDTAYINAGRVPLGYEPEPVEEDPAFGKDMIDAKK